ALELDPLNPILNTHLGWHDIMVGRYDEAVARFTKTLDLDPDYGLAQWYLGLAYEQKGMYPEAIDRLRRAGSLLQGHVAVEGDLGHAFAVAHREAEARAILARLRELSRRRYVPAFEIALIEFGLGRRDEGFAALETAYRDRADLLVYLE